MQTMHLFAGAGGGLYADLILGHNPVCAVELESYPCQILRQKREEGWFPQLEIWEGDIRKFNPENFKGKVDCIAGGFPCQDISAAGKGAGITGERSGLWSEYVRIIRTVKPRWVFVENSPMLTSRGLDTVLRDLASMGYDAEWCVLGADSVGAPHRRKRIWLLAYCNCYRGGIQSKPWEECQKAANLDHYGKEKPLANSNPQRLQRGCKRERANPQGRQKQDGSALQCSEVCDSDSIRKLQSKGSQQDSGGWISDSGWWSTEPSLGRVADGVANRSNRIKALGNGQVPLTAALAFTLLKRKFNK